MLGTYFYHQILRKTVVAFGTVFNDIRIRHKSSTSQPGGELRVPLAYGPCLLYTSPSPRDNR